MLIEGGRETGTFQAEKWDADQIRWTAARDYYDARLLRPGQEPDHRHFYAYGCQPYEVYRTENCNAMTSAGWAVLLNRANFIAGSGGTLFSTTVGRVGLGVGAPAGYSDTALTSVGALTGSNWILCGTAPTYTAASGTVTPATFVFTATFGTAAADGVAITEFAVDQGTASAGPTVTATAPMINHGTCAAGTKTSAQTWNVTVTLTFT